MAWFESRDEYERRIWREKRQAQRLAEREAKRILFRMELDTGCKPLGALARREDYKRRLNSPDYNVHLRQAAALLEV